MKIRTLMLATAGTAALFAGDAAVAAPRHHAAAASNGSADATRELMQEVQALKEQVQALQDRLDQQGQFAAENTAQVNAAATQAAAASAKADAVTTQVAAQQKSVEKLEHPDKFNFKGITITPGGFLELAGIYRSRFQGDDIASSFSIPFPGQSHQSHVGEGRFSARQSRVSFLAQGNVNPKTALAMYGEFDFQGAAQTSNSNQSNSYVPRIRNLYGTIDWNRGSYGIHVLAGQNWSLLTMNSKGITPRNEVTPPQIDAQYVPGFFWARQPGVRVTGDFLNHKLWLAVSAENPQTTFGGTAVPANITSSLSGQNGTASPPTGSFQQFYNGVGSSLSLSQVPDFIGKVAYEDTIAGHTFHVEGFGIHRTFTDHINGTQSNNNAQAFGYGGSIGINVIPKVLDVQFSGIGGKGIGRYGSAGLPDVTFDAAGRPKPLSEFMLLAGGTLHATPKLDIYAFAGEEQEYRKILDASHGLGVPGLANNSGCFVEPTATATTGTCSGNTRRIRQITGGVWDKFYQGSFGRAQIGFQWSYTQRQLFVDATGNQPQTHNNMGFVSFRYYPF